MAAFGYEKMFADEVHKLSADVCLYVHAVGWINEWHNISYIFQATAGTDSSVPEITFEKEPPPIEWHIARDITDKLDILTVSPVCGLQLIIVVLVFGIEISRFLKWLLKEKGMDSMPLYASKL